MKNYSRISIFLLALLAFFMFTGCPTDPAEEVDYTTTDPVTATYEFTNELKTVSGDTKARLLGDFPQSFIADDVRVNLSVFEQHGDYKYYVGTDGNYYAKVGSGNDKFYKVEPIKWRILTYDFNGSGKMLLLAENILSGCKFYDTTTTGVDVSDREGIYPNNYKESRMRAYLNGLSYPRASSENTDFAGGAGFINTAFSASAQALIATTTVVNNERSSLPENWETIQANLNSSDENVKADAQFDTSGFGGNSSNNYSYVQNYECDDTHDKIFLLSEEEVTNYDYGFKYYSYKDLADPARVRKATAFAEAMGVGGSSSTHWALRSPQGNMADDIKSVSYKGEPNEGDRIVSSTFGVVPALVLD